MASGRIRRSARRGLAVAVLGWLAVAAFSVLMAPSASAAPSATVTIQNVTPPAVSVDKGGTVTFVNGIPAQNKGGISIPLLGSVSATVHTDVAVDASSATKRDLQYGKSTRVDVRPAGDDRHAHLHLPDRARSPGLTADRGQPGGRRRRRARLPPLPRPDAVRRADHRAVAAEPARRERAAAADGRPSRCPTRPAPCAAAGGRPDRPAHAAAPTADPATPTEPAAAGHPGDQYAYDLGGGHAEPGAGRHGRGRGVRPVAVLRPGAEPPVRRRQRRRRRLGRPAGQLRRRLGAGLRPARRPRLRPLDEQAAADDRQPATAAAPALPAAALAAVVALAAVTAALVRTHQAAARLPLSAALSAPRPSSFRRGRRPRSVRRHLWTAGRASPRTLVACPQRVPALAGARDACTTLLLQIRCSR